MEIILSLLAAILFIGVGIIYLDRKAPFHPEFEGAERVEEEAPAMQPFQIGQHFGATDKAEGKDYDPNWIPTSCMGGGEDEYQMGYANGWQDRPNY